MYAGKASSACLAVAGEGRRHDRQWWLVGVGGMATDLSASLSCHLPCLPPYIIYQKGKILSMPKKKMP